MYFKVALLASGILLFSGCATSGSPKPTNPSAVNKNIGVEVVEEITEEVPVTSVSSSSNNTRKVVKKKQDKPKPKVKAKPKPKAKVETKTTTKAKEVKKEVVKKAKETKKKKPTKYIPKKKTTKPKNSVLKPEPFSLESNEEDPELLGPQSTINRPLVRDDEE